MYLFTCPQTVPRASSRSMRLPVSSSLDGMPAASRGASLGDITSGQQSLPGSPTGIEETRETMRKFLLIFAFFFVVLPIRATDLYIAQTATGGNTGADCSGNAKSRIFRYLVRFSRIPILTRGHIWRILRKTILRE